MRTNQQLYLVPQKFRARRVGTLMIQIFIHLQSKWRHFKKYIKWTRLSAKNEWHFLPKKKQQYAWFMRLNSAQLSCAHPNKSSLNFKVFGALFCFSLWNFCNFPIFKILQFVCKSYRNHLHMYLASWWRDLNRFFNFWSFLLHIKANISICIKITKIILYQISNCSY